MSFSATYVSETIEILQAIDPADIEAVAHALAAVRERDGRLFILGVGGSAGHASHATCDFRKLCLFEAYCPTDNVSELTARTNDDGWDSTLSNWLIGSRLRAEDGLLVFSVGGGDAERGISANLVSAIQLAKEVGATVTGIVGRDGGTTAELADAAIVVPPSFSERVTFHTEGITAVLWHLLVSHPTLQRTPSKWESATGTAAA